MQKGSLRTTVLALVLIPSIAALLWYADQRNKQFSGKAEACRDQCTAQGYQESEFKWAALKDGECFCR
jgi:hypothetical protein